jgi:hypothetical protein
VRDGYSTILTAIAFGLEQGPDAGGDVSIELDVPANRNPSAVAFYWGPGGADTLDDQSARAARLIAGIGTPADVEWMLERLATWARAGGVVSLERIMRLPQSPKAHLRLQRNRWLCEAVKYVKTPTSRGVAQALCDALNEFLSSGIWLAWRKLQEPPQDASALRRALFHVAKCNGGAPISVKTINRVMDKI